MAVWEAKAPRQVLISRKSTSARLPTPTQDVREGWLYAVLAGLCLLLLGHEFWAIFQAAGNWRNFVEFVRQLLA